MLRQIITLDRAVASQQLTAWLIKLILVCFVVEKRSPSVWCPQLLHEHWRRGMRRSYPRNDLLEIVTECAVL